MDIGSMGLVGSEYGLFLKQLDVGQLGLALTYAAGLKLSLADALRLCHLMAKEGDERYSCAASRWVERLGAETAAGLPESSSWRRRSDGSGRTPTLRWL